MFAYDNNAKFISDKVKQCKILHMHFCQLRPSLPMMDDLLEVH